MRHGDRQRYRCTPLRVWAIAGPVGAKRLQVAGLRDRGRRLRRGLQAPDGSLELLVDAPEGDPEDPLSLLEQVDDLAAGGGGVDRAPVGEQRHVLEGGLELVGDVTDGLADLREAYARVEQVADHAEVDQVPEGIQPLRTGSLGLPVARNHQSGACPVVELAVRDPYDRAGLRPAKALVRHYRSPSCELHREDSRT